MQVHELQIIIKLMSSKYPRKSGRVLIKFQSRLIGCNSGQLSSEGLGCQSPALPSLPKCRQCSKFEVKSFQLVTGWH